MYKIILNKLTLHIHFLVSFLQFVVNPVMYIFYKSSNICNIYI